MAESTVKFALVLALCGTFGCAAQNPFPFRFAEPAAPQPAPLSPIVSVPNSNDSVARDPSIAAQRVHASEITALVPSEPSETKIAAKDPEKKSARPATTAKSAKAPEPVLRNLQKVRGPRADDRLLDLLEKDLDKAVEQPVQARRLEFSPAVIENPKVRYFIDYFSKRGKADFELMLARSGRFLPMISAALREEGLPQEFAYLALIESGFIVNATSIHGAAGLWQFVPSTARKYGLRIDRWVDERRDPLKSTRAAAAYLKDLHDYFGRWHLATAAYNAGLGAVDRAMQNAKSKDFSSVAENAKLREETRNFVPKFVAVTLIASAPERYGIADIAYESPVKYEEIGIDTPAKLVVLARRLGTDAATLRELNPALLRDATPPGKTNFRLKVPPGATALLARQTAPQNDGSSNGGRVFTHEVKKGDTLFAIARRYGQDVRALMEFNGLTDSRLRIGQRIRILIRGLTGSLR